MAAGELWVNTSTGALSYRDSTNTLRTITGITLTTNPLGMTDTPGEVAVTFGGALGSRLYWNTNQTSGGLRVRRYAIISSISYITGTFVLGEILVRGSGLYVAYSTTRAGVVA